MATSSSHEQLKQQIPVGIVGGGRVGVGFLKFLQRMKEVRVTGIVTSTEDRRRELTAEYKVPAFADVPSLMASADKPSVVCVVNANDAHCEATIQALEAGAHVYCEKPMAPTLAECVRMVEAEKKSGRHLQIGFEYMHGTMTSRLRQLVADGYFGDVLWASVLDSRGHWWADAPDVDPTSIWKLDRKRGGGIIFHCGIHQLDMIRCYLGPIDEIAAYRPPRNAFPFYPSDVPDNVTLMLKARSGAVCNFQVFHNRAPTWYREVPAFNPDWRKVPGHEFGVSLVGSKASCQMSIYGEQLHLFKFDLVNKETVFDRTEVFSPNPSDKSHHDMKGLLQRFIHSVGNGGGAIDKATDALETMRLAFAAEDAIVRGGTVRVGEYR
jgi:predicted dehydrogenase